MVSVGGENTVLNGRADYNVIRTLSLAAVSCSTQSNVRFPLS